ncbi:MAG TPA: phosphoenolpyruvate carboxylase [Phenylobacterium sp.]|nr:phosphoenolpyruvate carboxylase [Phenylobacterium sp.]
MAARTTSLPEQLRETVRLLGRLLGDVIREEDGQAVFDQIEAIRQASVGYHREGTADAARLMSERLEGLSLSETVRFVHSFACFLQITNIAEDHIQRHRGDVGDDREDTLAGALRALRAEGTSAQEVLALLAEALVAPVITAHPSEVRRKSVLDRQAAIAGRLEALAGAAGPAETARIERDMRREMSLLWRTRLLRGARIGVEDEIENAVFYLTRSILAELPRLYAHWTDLMGAAVPSFLRVGSWVGGDRDGNPNITDAVMRRAMARQSKAALDHYLERIHDLGAALSVSSSLVDVSPPLAALARQAHDASPHRADEPYRQALTGIYARLSATYRDLVGAEPTRPPAGAAEPYDGPDALRLDLQTVQDSLLPLTGRRSKPAPCPT